MLRAFSGLSGPCRAFRPPALPQRTKSDRVYVDFICLGWVCLARQTQPRQMKSTYTRSDFVRWGRAGGLKARHGPLSPEKARSMVKAREDRKKAVAGQADAKTGLLEDDKLIPY